MLFYNSKMMFISKLMLAVAVGLFFQPIPTAHQKYENNYTITDTLLNPCQKFNELNHKIIYRTIRPDSAQNELIALIPQIEEFYKSKNGKQFKKINWVFPVKGYSWREIGGKNGNGYIANHFKYYEKTTQKSHPAQDIFIFDKNQDMLDDRTKKPVDILSMSGGIVISKEAKWDVNSELKGGKYVTIYDPDSKGIFYYAHNDSIFVEVGDIVEPGSTIAIMGRTGLNAFKKRSPTHLHIMYLQVKPNGDLIPQNIYKDLVNCKKYEHFWAIHLQVTTFVDI